MEREYLKRYMKFTHYILCEKMVPSSIVLLVETETTEGQMRIAVIYEDRIEKTKVYKKWRGMFGEAYMEEIDDKIEELEKELMIRKVMYT